MDLLDVRNVPDLYQYLEGLQRSAKNQKDFFASAAGAGVSIPTLYQMLQDADPSAQ